MPRGKYFLPAEDKVLKDFVKERAGDELAPVRMMDSFWADLVKRWKALGKVKGFRTDRNALGMYKRHHKLRKKAGRVDSLPKGCKRAWSAEEEKALLDFVKERKGDEMAAMWSKLKAFKDLEEAWQSKGFDTARTAGGMYHKHDRMRRKRAEQPATTPRPSTTSSMTSTTAPAPSLSGSSRKRTASAAALTTSLPSANAKKPKSSPSPSASDAPSPPPPPSSVRVKNEAPDSDSELVNVKIEAMLEIKEERNH